MLYDVLRGYWRDQAYVFAVTDDLLMARTLAIVEIERSAGAMTRPEFAEFEEQFADFERTLVEDGLSLFFSKRDYHVQIRASALTVIVGKL